MSETRFTSTATVGQTPGHVGNGFDYGNSACVLIEGVVVQLGFADLQLAEEIARRWNAHAEMYEALKKAAHLVRSASGADLPSDDGAREAVLAPFRDAFEAARASARGETS